MISLRTFELSAGPKSAKIVSVPADGDIDSIKNKIFTILQIEPDHCTVTFHTTKNKKIDTTALPTNVSISSIGLQDNSILILRKKPDLQLRAEAESPAEVEKKKKNTPTSPAIKVPHTPVAISVKTISLADAGPLNGLALSVPQALRPLRATEEEAPTPVVSAPVPEKAPSKPTTPGSSPLNTSSPPQQPLATLAHTPPMAHSPPVPSAAKKLVPARAPLPPSPTSAGRHKQFSSLGTAEKVADTPQISALKQKIHSLQMENEELKEKLHTSCEVNARHSLQRDGFLQCEEGWRVHRGSLFSLVRQVAMEQRSFRYESTSFVERTHEYLLTVFFSKVQHNDLDVPTLLQRYGGAMEMLYNALSFQFKLTRTPKYEAVCQFMRASIPDLLCAVPVICHLYYNREPEFLEELFFTLRGSHASASTWVHLCLPHGKQLYYSTVCRFAQPLCPAVVETAPCVRVDVAGDTSTCRRLHLSNRCAEDQNLTAGAVLQSEILGATLSGRDTADMLLCRLQDQYVRADLFLKDALL